MKNRRVRAGKEKRLNGQALYRITVQMDREQHADLMRFLELEKIPLKGEHRIPLSVRCLLPLALPIFLVLYLTAIVPDLFGIFYPLTMLITFRQVEWLIAGIRGFL